MNAINEEGEERDYPAPRPSTPVINCPNCDEETLVLVKSRHAWICAGCGYTEAL